MVALEGQVTRNVCLLVCYSTQMVALEGQVTRNVCLLVCYSTQNEMVALEG